VWLNRLKSAVVLEDVHQVSKLLEELPETFTVQEAKEASFLLNQASQIAQKLKDKTSKSMVQIKKNINFLDSARADRKARFDITS